MKTVSWLFWAFAAVACAPGPSSVIVSQHVNVVVNAGPDQGHTPPGLRLDDPRVAAAERELTRLLGRALLFELDPALVPSFDWRLQAAFVTALERTVSELQYLSERHVDALAFAKAHLKTVRFKYAPTETPPRPELDVVSGVLAIGVSSNQSELVRNGNIADSVLDALELARAARYDGVPAERVPVSEQQDYFEYQTRGRLTTNRPGAAKLSSGEQEIVALGNVLALYPRVKDPALAKAARSWLAGAGSRLRRAYADKEAGEPGRSRARELRPAWIRWLNQAQAALDDGERRTIAELMFERGYSLDDFRNGFDVLGFAGASLQTWIQRSAHPAGTDTPGRVELLVTCPYTWDERTHRISRPSFCNGALYLDLFGGVGGPNELARLLIRSKSDLLSETALLHVATHRGVPAALELLALLDSDEQGSRAGLVALAAFDGWGAQRSPANDEVALDPTPLFDRIPVWWKNHPGRRPQVLFLLTELAHDYEGIIAWPKLPSYLGSRISAQEFSGFLDQSPQAIWFMQSLGPALADNWQKSAVLIPKLELWLTTYSRRAEDGPEPYYMTERVIELLCDTGTKQDLVELQTFLKKRLESFPSERQNLSSYAEKPVSELCPKQRDDTTKKPVLFGD